MLFSPHTRASISLHLDRALFCTPSPALIASSALGTTSMLLALDVSSTCFIILSTSSIHRPFVAHSKLCTSSSPSEFHFNSPSDLILVHASSKLRFNLVLVDVRHHCLPCLSKVVAIVLVHQHHFVVWGRWRPCHLPAEPKASPHYDSEHAGTRQNRFSLFIVHLTHFCVFFLQFTNRVYDTLTH